MSEPKIKKDKPTKEILEEAYNRLQSSRKVGKELGWSSGQIRIFMREYGLKTRTPLNKLYTCDLDFFSRDTEESFYIAGYLAADGCVKQKKNMDHPSIIGINLAIKDKEILEKMKICMKVTSPLRYKVSKSPLIKNPSKQYELSFSSRKMVEDLVRFGVIPRKTYIYKIPEWIVEHPLLKHYLRGLIDGDGTIRISEKGNSGISLVGTEIEVKQFLDILFKKGLTHENAGYIKKDKRKECWSASLGGNGLAGRVCEFLYKDAKIYLERKHKIYLEIDKLYKIYLENKNAKIVDIQKEELEKLFNEHKSLVKIAEILKCPIGIVRKCMKKYNIEYIPNSRKLVHDHTFFSAERESPEQFFWAGYLSGNSTIEDGRPRIILKCKNKEEIERFHNTKICGSPIVEGEKSYKLNFSSKQIIKDLNERFGITKDKKDNFILNDYVKNHQYLKYFLRGRFDTDGKLSDEKLLSIGANKKFLEQLVDIITNVWSLTYRGGIQSRILNGVERYKISVSSNFIKYLTE